MKSMLLLSSIGGIKDELILEAKNTIQLKNTRIFLRKRRFILVAAIVAAFLLCGFAAYQVGLFDPWLQKPSILPVETVKSAIKNQTEKEYTLNVQIERISIDDNATERAKRMYKGSNIAMRNGWTDSYLENNLIVVRAEYFIEYDHEKTFQPDGKIEQYFILLRDEGADVWKIWDNTTAGDPFS